MIHSTHSLLGQHEINDLRWYLERSEVEISGIRSPPLVRQQLKSGVASALRSFRGSLRCGPIHVGTQDVGAPDVEIDIRRIDAVERERPVRLALARMSRAEKEVLFLCFALELRDEREIYGRYGNVAERTATACAAHRDARSPRDLAPWLDHLGRRLRNGSATPDGFRAHLRIMTESRELARSAAAAYSRGQYLAAA